MLTRPLELATPSTATAAGGVVVAPDARHAPAASTPATGASARDQVEAAVQAANAALAVRDASLQFTIDPDTRKLVVRLVDTQNQQVLRQMPSEEMLAIARSIDRMELALLRKRV